MLKSSVAGGSASENARCALPLPEDRGQGRKRVA
jgi:hypothetical protein